MRVYREESSDYWWVDFRHRGRRYRRSTGETERRAAEVRAGAIRAAIVDAAPIVTGACLADLGGYDLTRAEAGGVSAAQRASVIAVWRHLLRLLGPDRDPKTVDYDLVEDYVRVRRGEGARGQSIRKEVQAVARGLKWARRQGYIRDVPDLPTVRSDPPKRTQRGKLHPPEVLQRWLAQLEGDARDEAEIILRTGIRQSELYRLRWSWVEPAPGGAGVPALLRIPAESTKSRSERVVGLTETALGILEARTAAHSGPLFGGHRNTHRRAREQASTDIGYPTSISFRDLRHTYSTLALQVGGDARAVQAALGHHDLRTTERYLSSTLTRTAQASAAVGSALGQTDRPGTDVQRTPGQTPRTDLTPPTAENPGCTGRGERIRTSGPLLPKQVRELITHVEACFSCQQLVARHADTQGVTVPTGQTKRTDHEDAA